MKLGLSSRIEAWILRILQVNLFETAVCSVWQNLNINFTTNRHEVGMGDIGEQREIIEPTDDTV